MKTMYIYAPFVTTSISVSQKTKCPSVIHKTAQNSKNGLRQKWAHFFDQWTTMGSQIWQRGRTKIKWTHLHWQVLCQASVSEAVASFRGPCRVPWRHNQTGRRRKVQNIRELRGEDTTTTTPAKPPSVFPSPTTAEIKRSRVAFWFSAVGSSRDGTSKTDWTRLWPLATRRQGSGEPPLGWSDQGCAVLARGRGFCLEMEWVPNPLHLFNVSIWKRSWSPLQMFGKGSACICKVGRSSFFFLTRLALFN